MNAEILEKTARTISRKVHATTRTRSQRKALLEHEHPVARSIGAAVEAVFGGDLTPDERAWVDRIERLRSELHASNEQVTVTGFGAGTPTSNLTAEEMQRGTTSIGTVGEICRNASKPPRWALLLHEIVRHVKPTTCIELGTCVGISSAYQSAALELNGAGRLVTLEGAESLARIAEANLASLGLESRVSVVVGRFDDTLEGALAGLRPVEYGFIDGHHDEIATLDYFERISKECAEGALLVFDDISWSAGMQEAWRRIRADDRVAVAVDFYKVGVCVLGPAPHGSPRLITIAID
jgi:predicted O-methyltransferase YrrM